jgi:hypothetical protein
MLSTVYTSICGFQTSMTLYIPKLSNLKGHTRIGLTSKKPLTWSVHVHFENEVLVALEHRIFHNPSLLDKILQLTRPGIEVLVPIGRSLLQVEALDAAILDSLLHSLVQIRVEFLGVKPWSTEHSNGLLELNVCPPVRSNVYPPSIYCDILVYSAIYLKSWACLPVYMMSSVGVNLFLCSSSR